MKSQALFTRFSSNEFIKLFSLRADNTWHLDPCYGSGSVRRFDIEAGLEANVWECSFNRSIEIVNESSNSVADRIYVITYLFDTDGLQFAKANDPYQKAMWCDNLFLTEVADYRLFIPSSAKLSCLTIQFSFSWIHAILENNIMLKNARQIICHGRNICLARKMDLNEMKQLKGIFGNAKDQYSVFFVKSVILKIICQFMHMLNDHECYFPANANKNTVSAEVVNFLKLNKSARLPELSTLSEKYLVSKSTIRRWFKEQYGLSISSYLQKTGSV